MAKLKIAGTWAGVLEDVDLEAWTLATLRHHVATRSNSPPHSINLICAGKILKHENDAVAPQTLSQLGVKNNSKILATRVTDPHQGQSFLAEEERSSRLDRIRLFIFHFSISKCVVVFMASNFCFWCFYRAAATAMAGRHSDGALPIEDFNIEVEDQSGQKVRLGTETDQRYVKNLILWNYKP